MSAVVADKCVSETLPKVYDANSEQPPFLDGSTKLYLSYTCPYAQRVWTTRNFKGLQDQIQLVPIDLKAKPAWYTEKVYPPGKVPSFEYNGKVMGESLELVKFLDANFEGPSLTPEDPAKKAFAEEVFAYCDKFCETVHNTFGGGFETTAAAEFDYFEKALEKFEDGPFFLGAELSYADIAYVTAIERFHLFFTEFHKYDLTAGRPKLAAWIEAMDHVQAYKQTKPHRDVLIELFKSFMPSN